jgi:hypothetical protein
MPPAKFAELHASALAMSVRAVQRLLTPRSTYLEPPAFLVVDGTAKGQVRTVITDNAALT